MKRLPKNEHKTELVPRSSAKPKLYLAGPMRGIPKDNFPAFHEAAKRLRSQGFSVWSPAENDMGAKTFNECMAKDLPQVCLADGVAVLRGWEKSQGANIEIATARALGKFVICAESLQRIEDDNKPTNPKDVIAIDKLDLTLFPATAIAYGAMAFAEGDLKYGGFNWREGGVLATVYASALLRHFVKWYNGEWADEKTTVPHLASILACAAIMIDAHELGVLRDDRPPVADLGRVIGEGEVVVRHMKTLFKNGPRRRTANKTTERK